MDNQQDYILNNNQIQVLLTGTFGDGCIVKTKSNNSYYQTNCIHKEYMEYKGLLLGDLWNCRIRKSTNLGYKKDSIYTIFSKYKKSITELHELSIETKLSLLDDLGLALWFYDDGSLHKKNQFYNLNTHSFSKEIQEDIFIPYFKNMGLNPKVLTDRKKDGRIFYYLYFSRAGGSFEITSILQKYRLDCFEYKMWSSETIQKWSKLLVQLKSENRVVTPRLMGDRMKIITL